MLEFFVGSGIWPEDNLCLSFSLLVTLTLFRSVPRYLLRPRGLLTLLVLLFRYRLRILQLALPAALHGATPTLAARAPATVLPIRMPKMIPLTKFRVVLPRLGRTWYLEKGWMGWGYGAIKTLKIFSTKRL